MEAPMFGRHVPLMRVFGFEIRFDLTWLILAALMVWTLSADYFPAVYRHLPIETYVWMSVLAAIGAIASIIVHELCHSLVARRFGMEIRGITLFVFGGAAEMREEPPTPRAEFFMAAAGPAASFVLAAAFYFGAAALAAMPAPMPLTGVFAYLAGSTSSSRYSILFRPFRSMAGACCAHCCGPGAAICTGRRAWLPASAVASDSS
jgi:Zn-dependent protease